jgi:predicted transcriptional regulator
LSTNFLKWREPEVSKWTFLTNHAIVLLALVNNPRITAIEIAKFVGITERTVRKIISDLERDGYIKKIKIGRRVQYQINPHLPLRQKSQQSKDVGRLLRTLSGKGNI